MKDLQKTDTFWDRMLGEIVCVTRVVAGARIQDTKYYGKYCTGPRRDDNLDYGFRQGDVYEHNDIHRDPRKAFAEANYGDHVAHCTNADATRTVAIRPREDGRFNIDCSADRLDIRRYVHALTEKQARHLVDMFLYGKAVKIDYPYCGSWINQAKRDVEILVDTMTPTRVRIQYDMPYTGTHGAWRKQAQVDQYIFIET